MTDGPSGFPQEQARRLVTTALLEDLGPEGLDVTTMATIPVDQERVAQIVARGPGVVAGVPVVPIVLEQVARLIGGRVPRVEVVAADGARVERGDVIVRLSAQTQVILMAERTILNILCRLSGVATHTRAWTDRLDGTATTVLDTRKTTPGMRLLEKYAVRAGGGANKRMGLYDAAMVKDNHKLAAGSVAVAYALVKARFPDVEVEVEVTTPAEASEAYGAGARFIMCDNMSPEVLRETVDLLRAAGDLVEIEATGGLTLGVVVAYAATGVDFVSVGALTHSSPIVDLSIDLLD